MNKVFVAFLSAAASLLLLSPTVASASGTPAHNQAAASAPADAEAKQPAAAEKKICKQLPSSNSRLPNKTCLTAAQWKQVEDDKD